MTDFIQNYSAFRIGMQVGDTYTDLTKYAPDFNLTLDSQFEDFQFGGEETQSSVPTGAMTPFEIVGYVLSNRDPAWSDIFEDETEALFMVYSTKSNRAFAFRGQVNTNAIDTSTGVLTKAIPVMVSGGDWTTRLQTSEDYTGIDNGAVPDDSHVFVYITETLSGNLAVEEGANNNAAALSDLQFTAATPAPSIYLHALTAGDGRDVELDGSPADKARVLWGIAAVRD